MAWWQVVLMGGALFVAAAINVGCGGGALLSFVALAVGLPSYQANMVNILLIPVSFVGVLLSAPSARSVQPTVTAGVAAAPGSVGAAGPVGAVGSAGPVGAVGSAGPADAVGSAGPVGAVGSAGPVGAVGSVTEARRPALAERLEGAVPDALAALTAAGGAALLLAFPAGEFAVLAPWLTATATVLLAVSPRLRRLAGGARRPVGLLAALVPVGGYAGFFGAGTGQLLTTVIMMTDSGDHHRVHAVRRRLSFPLSFAPAAVVGWVGSVPWSVVLALVPCAALGGLLGGRAARRCSERVLRWSAVGLGAAATGWMMIT